MYIVLRIVCFSGIEKDEVHQPDSKFVIANSIFISHRRSTSPVLSQVIFFCLYTLKPDELRDLFSRITGRPSSS